MENLNRLIAVYDGLLIYCARRWQPSIILNCTIEKPV